MNSNNFYQLAAELNVMDFTKSKPNYTDLAKKYGVDYRTVKKYHEGYKGKPRNRAKPDMPIHKEPTRPATRLWTGLEATVVNLTP